MSTQKEADFEYDDFYRHIARTIRFLPAFSYVAVVILPLMIFGILYVLTLNEGWLAKVTSILYILLLGTFGILLTPLVLQGLGYGKSEQQLVKEGLKYLRENRYATATINTIAERAEINNSASQIRGILPVLIISLSLFLLDNNQWLTLNLWLVAFFLIVALIIPLTIDLYKTSIDSAIRHSIIEYKHEKEREASKNRQIAEIAALDALLTIQIPPEQD